MGMYPIFKIRRKKFEFQHSVLGKWLWVSPITFLIVHFLACNACVTELFREVNELMDCEIILWAIKHFWPFFSLYSHCSVFLSSAIAFPMPYCNLFAYLCPTLDWAFLEWKFLFYLWTPGLNIQLLNKCLMKVWMNVSGWRWTQMTS